MPRGQKSKRRAREERRRNRGVTQGLNAQATTAGVGETTSSPASVSRGTPPSPLLLALARSLREPQPRALVLQGFHAQDMMYVPRAKLRKVKIPPRPQPPGILERIL